MLVINELGEFGMVELSLIDLFLFDTLIRAILGVLSQSLHILGRIKLPLEHWSALNILSVRGQDYLRVKSIKVDVHVLKILLSVLVAHVLKKI